MITSANGMIFFFFNIIFHLFILFIYTGSPIERKLSFATEPSFKNILKSYNKYIDKITQVKKIQTINQNILILITAVGYSTFVGE